MEESEEGAHQRFPSLPGEALFRPLMEQQCWTGHLPGHPRRAEDGPGGTDGAAGRICEGPGLSEPASGGAGARERRRLVLSAAPLHTSSPRRRGACGLHPLTKPTSSELAKEGWRKTGEQPPPIFSFFLAVLFWGFCFLFFCFKSSHCVVLSGASRLLPPPYW